MDEIDEILAQTEVSIDGVVVDQKKEDDIDDLINEIDIKAKEQYEEITTRETTTPAVVKENEIDLDEKHDLANRIVENSLDVINKANLVFTNFADDVMHGKDRSTSSKEMLIKALEIQNSANKNLIDLSKSLKGDDGSTNILIANQISPKKSGVDPNNLRNHFKK